MSSSSSEKLGASSSVHYTAALLPAVEQELRGERSLDSSPDEDPRSGPSMRGRPAIRDRGERRTAGGRSGPRPLCVAVRWAVRTAPTSCHHLAQLAFLWAQIREVVLRRHCVERGESTQQRCRVWQRLQHLPGHVVVGTMRGLAGWLVCRQEASRRGCRGIWRKTKHEHERHDGPRKHQPPHRRHGELAQGRAGSQVRRDARAL